MSYQGRKQVLTLMDDTGLSKHIPPNLALILFHMKVHDIFRCILNVPYYSDNFNSGADVIVTFILNYIHGKKNIKKITDTCIKFQSVVICLQIG